MAANFWQSAHCRTWLLDATSVSRCQRADLQRLQLTRSDLTLMRRYFTDVIHEVGLRLALRHRVIATAQLLFLRFYSRPSSSPSSASFCTHDPRLVAPTALFVAAKAEECPLNARSVVAVMNKMRIATGTTTNATQQQQQQQGGESGLSVPTASLINESAPAASAAAAAATTVASVAAASSTGAVATPASATPASGSGPNAAKSAAIIYPYTAAQLLEMEFALLSGLQYDLVVWHPYRPLEQFLTSLGHLELMQQSTEIVNDCYRCDLALLHPPYLLALAAIYIACTFQQVDCSKWMQSINVEKERLLSIVRTLLSLWDEAESYAQPATRQRILTMLRSLNDVHAHALAHGVAAAPAAATAAVPAKSPLPSPSTATHSSAAPPPVAASAAVAAGAARSASLPPRPGMTSAAVNGSVHVSQGTAAADALAQMDYGGQMLGGLASSMTSQQQAQGEGRGAPAAGHDAKRARIG